MSLKLQPTNLAVEQHDSERYSSEQNKRMSRAQKGDNKVAGGDKYNNSCSSTPCLPILDS